MLGTAGHGVRAGGGLAGGWGRGAGVCGLAAGGRGRLMGQGRVGSATQPRGRTRPCCVFAGTGRTWAT